MTTTDLRPLGETSPGPETRTKIVALKRRTIDEVLIGIGAVVFAVCAVAAGLLTWGNAFAGDYVGRELSSQHITFPTAAALSAGGRDDLLGHAGQVVDTGDEAEAYASYIDGHLAAIAGGATYADLGATQTAANAAVTAATGAGKPADEVAALRAAAAKVTAERASLFQGETLRGLLLSAYAWSTVGTIAGYAAIAAYVAAAVMLVLVVLGLIHLRRTGKPSVPSAVLNP